MDNILDATEKDLKYNKLIESIINLNLDIEKGIFKKTRFLDDKVEKKFIEFQRKQSKTTKILSDLVLIAGYIASLIYILFAFYKIEFLIICLVCKVISVVFMVLSYISKNQKFILFCEHVGVFCIAFSLGVKGLMVNFKYNNPLNDHEAEMIRIIIYYFVSTNIFIFFKFQENFLIYFSYLVINILLIIVSEIYSNKNNFYFLEGFTSILFSAIFFGFRKVYDYLLRVIYSEKFKFERYYNYTFDFISCLNCFHVNFKNNDLVYYDQKFENFLNYLIENFKDSNFLNKPSDKTINNNEFLKKENFIPRINANHNILDVSKYLENDKFLVSQVADNNNFTQIISDKNYESKNANQTQNEKSGFTNEFVKNLIPSKEALSDNLDMNPLRRNDTTNNITQSNINKNIINEENLEELEGLNDREISLYLLLNKLRYKDKLKINDQAHEEDSDDKNFINLGIYNFKNPEIKKYFEVYYRKIHSDDINFYYDLLFYDVSELILSKKVIFEQNIVKQNILAKIAHEFKTPINSIIGLINNIKENIVNNQKTCKNISNYEESYTNDLARKKNDNKKNNKLLDIIQNLSKYVIFLVSDIIQYSNLKDINQINLIFDKLNIRELANFCFEILKCLLKCNRIKYESVKPELIFDDIIDEKIISLDEIRFKQILLNILSNSVKFTKHGKISLKFKYDYNTKEVFITIEDTGIGIKEEDKVKLFNDFVMLKNGQDQNKQGSGLGLSICKSLAANLNIKLNFESVYGQGTKFFVIVPAVDNDKKPFQINHKNSNNITNISYSINKDASQIKEIKHNKEQKEENEPREARPNKPRRVKTRKSVSKVDSSNMIKHLNMQNINFAKENYGITFAPEKKNASVSSRTVNNTIKFINDIKQKEILNDTKQERNNISLSNSDRYDNLNETNEKTRVYSNNLIFIHNVHNYSFQNLNRYEYVNSSKISSTDIIKKRNISDQKEGGHSFSTHNGALANKRRKKKKIREDNINKNDKLILLNLDESGDDLYRTSRTSSNNSHSGIYADNKNKSKKILVVDDNQFINDSVKFIIDSIIKEMNLDFEVIQCNDGIDMIKLIVEDQKEGSLIKCVLSDENMEYINGSEAMKILRTLENNNKIKSVKLFSISSQEDHSTIKMILASGADQVLGKPVSKMLITNCFEEHKIFI